VGVKREKKGRRGGVRTRKRKRKEKRKKRKERERKKEREKREGRKKGKILNYLFFRNYDLQFILTILLLNNKNKM
jgi:hypothetical protein